jgi:hypothetical protein
MRFALSGLEGREIEDQTRYLADQVLLSMDAAAVIKIRQRVNLDLSPLLSSTRGLINASSINKMKQSAFLLNVERGQLIVEDDLAAVLYPGGIAGAAVDVLSTEPPAPVNPVLGAKKLDRRRTSHGPRRKGISQRFRNRRPQNVRVPDTSTCVSVPEQLAVRAPVLLAGTVPVRSRIFGDASAVVAS